jgi:hypothetical protein
MLIFDAMAREVCTSRRISTNTPLQALVTLNDSAYVEAAYHFAQRMMQEGGVDAAEQIRYGYDIMMHQQITDEKLEVLLGLYEKINDDGIIRKTAYTTDETIWTKHEKAMIVVANAMLNLDEFLMKN